MIYFLSAVNNETYSYEFKLLDGDTSKIKVIDDTPDDGIRFKGYGVRNGRAIAVDHIPTIIEIGGPKRDIPKLYKANTLLVDQSFKEILELLEPDVHQFFPIELVWKDGSHATNKYWFNPCNRLDSVDREKTTKEFTVIWKGGGSGEFVFSRSQIGSCHAWIDKFISGGGILISETFAQKLKEANLSGLSLKPYKSVA